ncbi:MAG: hypothetical protein Q8K29_12240 [Polaromonas sp.]|nr:hypothetical protein [Polaromonas sp.]
MNAVFPHHFSLAQELQQQREALQLITEAARSTCADLPLTATERKITLSAEATAKLAGMAKKLSDLGVQGALAYSQVDSARALLESDILPAMKDQNACRIYIFDRLEKKLLNPAPAPSKKVSLLCKIPEPYDGIYVVEWDDADRSHMSIDGHRLPDRHPDPNRNETRKVHELSDTFASWCNYLEGKMTSCKMVSRVNGKIFVGMPSMKPEATGDCKRITSQPVKTSF